MAIDISDDDWNESKKETNQHTRKGGRRRKKKRKTRRKKKRKKKTRRKKKRKKKKTRRKRKKGGIMSSCMLATEEYNNQKTRDEGDKYCEENESPKVKCNIISGNCEEKNVSVTSSGSITLPETPPRLNLPPPIHRVRRRRPPMRVIYPSDNSEELF